MGFMFAVATKKGLKQKKLLYGLLCKLPSGLLRSIAEFDIMSIDC